MATFTSFIAAGVDLGFWGFTDSDGDLVGSTATAPANGNTTGSPMLRVFGLQTVEGGVPTPEAVPVEGDNGVLGSFIFDAVESTSFQISKGQFDLTLKGLMQGTTPIAQGSSSLTLGVVRPKPLEYPDGAWILQSDAKKKGGASEGKSGWSGFLIPSTNVIQSGRAGFATRAPANDQLTVIVNPTNRYPYGVTLKTSVEGAETGDMFDFTQEYPITMHRHSGDGAVVTFLLPYKPVSVAETLVRVGTATGMNLVTVSSVSTTFPYSFTLAAAPVASAKIITTYAFQR
jgi:hypothetical protein